MLFLTGLHSRHGMQCFHQLMLSSSSRFVVPGRVSVQPLVSRRTPLSICYIHLDRPQGTTDQSHDRSRGRLISRLDRILRSQKAQTALSTMQLAHVQYLRDYWAEREHSKDSSDRDLRQMDLMTHETKEVLSRYAKIEHESSAPPVAARINAMEDSDYRKRLLKVEQVFGSRIKHVVRDFMPFKNLIAIWLVAAALFIPLLLFFERTLTWLFPERARALEEAEIRRYQEVHELFYGEAKATKTTKLNTQYR